MIILYDNYDSFTYNLLHYLQQYNLEVRVIRNDEKNTAEIAALNPRGVVLSPGPGRPEKSGGLMELIAHFHNKCPVLRSAEHTSELQSLMRISEVVFYLTKNNV